MPVFPAVASRTRPPGFNSPRFSASRIIHLPARSFTDWPGFMNSALPRMVQPVISEARVSLINGVLPIASTTSLLMVMCLNRRFLPDHSATLEPFPFRWNRNGALDSCFDAFSSREPVSTSLENALVDRRRAHKPMARRSFSKGSAPSTGFCEHNLAHIDISREKSGLAISEVIFPQPPEPVVEAERRQARPGLAEIISPGRQCLGIILSENAFANDGNAEPLAQRFQHLRRGQHSAGENITLDEIDLAAIGLEQVVLNGDGLDAGEAAGQQPV